MLLIVTTLQLNCQWKESDNPIEKKGLGSFYFFFGDIYETTGSSINKYANGNKHTLADSFITNIGSYKILQYGDTLFMSVSDNWYKGNGLFYPKTKTFHKSTDKGFTWTYIADLPSAANNYYIYKDKIYITAGIKILIYDPKTSIWDTLITNHLIDNIAFKNDTLVGIHHYQLILLKGFHCCKFLKHTNYSCFFLNIYLSVSFHFQRSYFHQFFYNL